MSKYQYRLTVNGATGKILNEYPGEQWSRIAEVIDFRGGIATLERRLITDHDILPMLTDPTGFIKPGDKVVCPWEVIAEVETR